MAKFDKTCLKAAPEVLPKKIGKSFEVTFPENRDGVMIGTPVFRGHAKGNISVGPLLNPTGSGYTSTSGGQIQ